MSDGDSPNAEVNRPDPLVCPECGFDTKTTRVGRGEDPDGTKRDTYICERDDCGAQYVVTFVATEKTVQDGGFRG